MYVAGLVEAKVMSTSLFLSVAQQKYYPRLTTVLPLASMMRLQPEDRELLKSLPLFRFTSPYQKKAEKRYESFTPCNFRTGPYFPGCQRETWLVVSSLCRNSNNKNFILRPIKWKCLFVFFFFAVFWGKIDIFTHSAILKKIKMPTVCKKPEELLIRKNTTAHKEKKYKNVVFVQRN